METEKKYELPKEFATKWVEALRSGNYTQTQEYLGKNEDGECKFCCLGVAASMQGIPIKEMVGSGELEELLPFKNDEDNYDYEYLTDLGVPIELIKGMLPNELIELNDKKNYSFSMIADWIEQNVNFL